MKLGVKFESYSLSEILNNHTTLSKEISKRIKPLEYFREYLKFGYYPFYFETPNQIDKTHKIEYSKIGDFLLDNKYIVEIGGKNKSFKQIKDLENSFVVADDIEVGFVNKIPLWLFGFLY